MDSLKFFVLRVYDYMVVLLLALLVGMVLGGILEWFMGGIWDNYFEEQDAHLQEMVYESYAYQSDRERKSSNE